MTRRIFISSVQLELAAERKAVVDGISATECEYDEATRLGLPRFVPVKGKSDARRDKRERALYFVQYIEEVGSGTTDIFEHCASHGLEPPIFEVDARHVSVTVMRPTFDEHGRKVGRKTSEVGAKGTEVGQKMAELGAKGKEVGQKNAEVGAKGKKLGANPAEVGANGEEFRANFDFAMANYRKDFRETCFKVWQLLREDSSLTQRDIYPRLRLAYSSVQSAYNALQEVGLLRREGRGRGSNWIVVYQPSQPITKPLEPSTNARKPITKVRESITKRRVSAKKGKEAK